MNSIKIELYLHVIAVIIALGVTFAYPFLQAFGERSGVASTRFTLRFIHRMETFVVLPGAALVFVFGGLLIGNSNLSYKDDMPVWLMVSVVWFLAAYAVSFFVQRRSVKKAIALLENVPDGPDLPADYTAVSKQMQMVGGLLGFTVIAIAFLMVWKPGQ